MIEDENMTRKRKFAVFELQANIAKIIGFPESQKWNKSCFAKSLCIDRTVKPLLGFPELQSVILKLLWYS